MNVFFNGLGIEVGDRDHRIGILNLFVTETHIFHINGQGQIYWTPSIYLIGLIFYDHRNDCNFSQGRAINNLFHSLDWRNPNNPCRCVVGRNTRDEWDDK